MATERELIATRKTIDGIREHVRADSLGYLSLDSLLDSVRRTGNTLCTACFTGDYPVPVQIGMDKLALETAA